MATTTGISVSQNLVDDTADLLNWSADEAVGAVVASSAVSANLEGSSNTSAISITVSPQPSKFTGEHLRKASLLVNGQVILGGDALGGIADLGLRPLDGESVLGLAYISEGQWAATYEERENRLTASDNLVASQLVGRGGSALDVGGLDLEGGGLDALDLADGEILDLDLLRGSGEGAEGDGSEDGGEAHLGC